MTGRITICDLEFSEAPLRFSEGLAFDRFAGLRGDRTLSDQLTKPRYRSLLGLFSEEDGALLALPLGAAIRAMKNAGDVRYLRFLNKYGDGRYCRFTIPDKNVQNLKGLYAYTLASELKYLGRCRDSFGKRVNQGYGVIHPKNCFRDGQATNCHLNSLIADCRPISALRFWIHPMTDDDLIAIEERRILATLKSRSGSPDWNIALT